MKYSELVELYEKLQSTTKRTEKTLHIAAFLRKIPADELEKATLLLEGKIYPAWDKRVIGIAKQLMAKAISASTGTDTKTVINEWKKTGDLGKASESLTENKKQATLQMHELTIEKVFDNTRKLSEITGHGSVERKIQLISELLTSARPKEAKYIVRTILENMQVGVGAGVMRDAITWAYLPTVKGLFPELDKIILGKTVKVSNSEEAMQAKDAGAIEAENESKARQIYTAYINHVQQAYDLTNDFSEVARTMKQHGLLGTKKLAIGTPLKVMLALKTDTIHEAFEKAGKPLQAEYKFDGFRVQIHRKGNDIRIFTRRLENVTKQFPEIAESVKNNVKGDNYILDAEAVGYDKKTGKYLPFQNISQRIKRKYYIEKMAGQNPVEVNVFDIMAHEGKSLIEEPFSHRRKLLEQIITPKEKSISAAKSIMTESEKEIEKLFKESKAKGNEGLMLKRLDAPYKPGARVGHMLKYKKTMENLDLAITRAEWGEGKRSRWLSSYTIACRNNEKLLTLGKVSTGLKEKPEEGLSFEEMTRILRPLVTSEEGRTATVKPTTIIEVAYEEIQRSPTYESGYALRFPRVVRLRQDKGTNDASTLQTIEQYYREQKKKTKPNRPAAAGSQ
ncbi:ATP-dependent DNA ligase [Candidatus Woesearchaeota archaeon]|nr:ATP-dependent DNA ligase [Candidatus Woesearchaeota archaeon]